MFIEEDDDRKQQFRCQVVREQPFRSTSNDVSQVTDRCNVDYQFLPCAPPLPPDTEDSDVVQLAVDSALAMPASDSATTQQDDALQSVARRRVRTKTRFGATKADTQLRTQVRFKRPPWFPRTSTMSPRELRCIQSFAASFEKAASMDFYITKYQGKPMESLTPLFRCMTQGIHRLECQEAEEEKAAQEKERNEVSEGENADVEPARKKSVRQWKHRTTLSPLDHSTGFHGKPLFLAFCGRASHSCFY